MKTQRFPFAKRLAALAMIPVLAAMPLLSSCSPGSKAQDRKTVQAAINAYTAYEIANAEKEIPEYMIYETEGRFVALRNGTADGVYPTQSDAMAALAPNAFISQLSPTSDESLFIYEPVFNPFAGKKLSVLGDSISTYANVSDNTEYNSTLGANADGGACYGPGGSRESYGLTQADVWWQQAIDALDMELCVDNSIGGGTVFYDRGEPRRGAYRYRCVNLHNDRTGETPDVIAIYLGTNDLYFVQEKMCSLGRAADIDYEALKAADFQPETLCEAYALLIQKMSQAYPNADVYCFTIIVRNGFDNATIEALNAEIYGIAAQLGATVVDLYKNSGIVLDDLPDGVHPKADGMDKITAAFVRAMLGESTSLHRIEWQLSGVTADKNDAAAVDGSSFHANLSYENGTVPSVSVTMGGTDVTVGCYADGAIHIPRVTGDLVITAGTETADTAQP